MEVPDTVTRYLSSGFARAGDLIAWWRSRRGDWCVVVRYDPEPRFELGVFPESGNWAHDLNGATLDRDGLARMLAHDHFGTDWRDDPEAATRLQEAATEPTQPGSRTTLIALDAARFEADFLFLPPDAARDPAVIWTRCRESVATQAHTIQAIDTLFADMDANPPNRSALNGAETVAADLFRKTVDVAARYKASLPWWLAAAGHSAGVGLLTPVEVRFVARHADALRRGLVAFDDVDALLSLIEAAAARGDWVAGWEPGT